MAYDVFDQPSSSGAVLLRGGTPASGKALTFLSETSGSVLIVPYNGERRIMHRMPMTPPPDWTFAFALQRGFELGFGDSNVEEESVVSKVSVGVELQDPANPTVLIDAWLKDIAANKRWYVRVGYSVMWFGVV